MKRAHVYNVDQAVDIIQQKGFEKLKFVEICTCEGSGVEGTFWEFLRYEYKDPSGPESLLDTWTDVSIVYKPGSTMESVVRDIRELFSQSKSVRLCFEDA